jgi:hypothetical protein
MNTPEQWAQVAFNAWMCEGHAVAHSGGGPDVVTLGKLDAEMSALQAAIARAVRAAVAEERERCARVAEKEAEDWPDWVTVDAMRNVAAAIREGRGP